MPKFRVVKRMEFCASHQLDLPYDSPCNRQHGHNYVVEITCEVYLLNNATGMVVDFKHLKGLVMDNFDHQDLNEVFGKLGFPHLQTTAEELAAMIVHLATKENENGYFITKVKIWETANNYVEYEV